MFIAHLPAGYLVSRGLRDPIAQTALLVGSVAPDLDILRFYFLDNQRIHHHEYLTHRPLLWMGIAVVSVLLWRFRPAKILGWFSAGALLHMLLDSFLGKINWGWPRGEFGGPLIVVPATQSHWILSFVLHWTFIPEIVICAAALWVYLGRRRNRP